MVCLGTSLAVQWLKLHASTAGGTGSIPGVQFDIDLPNKKVCINSEHSVDTLLETLGKTGKAVSYLGPK
ncbi:hypothetical protein FD755_001928 [Muntiacus reevesi]|uniref:HMA domain-containing protein n=2 Tax=Muntiacus TaxID=9885 RepID=A0A5J5N476_MUNRE|nr:hypothetical protein FD754_002140 [Muntiacus muntjak]KAB0386972.1 hypothetical protein FD755_001928 [Muntiacus reevesi]